MKIKTKMAGLGTKPNERKYPGFSQEKEGKWTGPFVFIHGADTQFGLKDTWNKVPEEKRDWKDEVELCANQIETLTSPPRAYPREFGF